MGAAAAQVAYYFCNDNNDPDTFHLFEVYDDPAVRAANADTDWFKEYMAAIGPLIESVEAHQTTPTWIKGQS